MQKTEEEEELGEEEEKADEGMEEVEQEVGPPLLTPLSEDAGKSFLWGRCSGGPEGVDGIQTLMSPTFWASVQWASGQALGAQVRYPSLRPAEWKTHETSPATSCG